jgi:outer membrane protein insertion porin family
MSAGVSGIWMSPFGLLSVSVAQPFRDRPGDDIQRFQFNFGTQF